MSWNIVLNKFCEIKRKAQAELSDIWAYDKSQETCLQYWVRMLNEEADKNLVYYLNMNEHEDLLLIRYGNYSEIFRREENVTFDSFWDLYDGFYRECRSVVIDIKKECLVLTPFRKFRNLNEGEETSYENVTKRIREASCVEFSNKLDGSMQAARFYNGKIVMAGSQSLNKESSWRLADGYRMLTEKPGYQQMLKDHPDETFIFEYISEKDAHVVNYDVEGLFLIGIRSAADGSEASYQRVLAMAKEYEIPATEVFDKTLDEIVKELDSKKSSEAEGFVVNIDGFKVKIKYNDYVYMHKALSAISSINLIIQNIAEDKFDDMLAKIPNAYRERIVKVAKIVYEYMNKKNAEVEAAFAAAPKDDRKTFMIWVTEHVDKEIRGCVRQKYLTGVYNVLTRSNGYIKLKDMGVEDYKGVSENEE